MQVLYDIILGRLLRFFCTLSTRISSGHSKTGSGFLSFIPRFMPPLCGVRKLWELKTYSLGKILPPYLSIFPWGFWQNLIFL